MQHTHIEGNMKKALILISVFLCVSILSGTDVSGNQSGTWTMDNNPYQVVGDITVSAGNTLTIHPGVNVEAMGDYRINVEGAITAEGTATSLIHFYSPDESVWGGIRLDNSSQGSFFSFCYIEHADNGINTLNTQLEITNCHFDNNVTGIHVYGLGNSNPPEVIINENLIENCQQNGIMIYEHNPIITNNEITQCALDESPRAAIQMACQSDGGICHPQIYDNHIHNNVWQGITAWDIYASGDISPTVRGNLIEENLTGIYLYDASGYFENNIIRNNFVPGNANSGAGVMLYGATTYPTFSQNIITGNYTGFYIINNANGDLGNTTLGTGRNIIYDNIDGSGTTHSIYSGSSHEIKAENCFWGTVIPAEIEETITGSVDYDPIYTTDCLARAFITGKVSNLVNPEVNVYLVEEETRDIVATGHSTSDSTYFLPVPFAGNYFVYVEEDVEDNPLKSIYDGISDPDVLHIEEETITTGIDIREFVEELPISRTIYAPFTHDGMEIYPYRYSHLIFWEKDYLLVDADEGVQIVGLVDYEPTFPETLWIAQTCWLVRNDDLEPGDTWVSADLGDDLTVNYLNALVTPYGETGELIVDYYEYNQEILYRRRFVEDFGLMNEKEYLSWCLENDYQAEGCYLNGGEGYMPLCEGNYWGFVRDMDHEGPMNLTAWHQHDNLYLFMWDPPFLDSADPFTGYWLYRNGDVEEMLDFTGFWTYVEVPSGNNEYYIAAITEQGESYSTNTLEINIQSIGDEPDPTPEKFLAAHIFPNPTNLASGSGISMSIASSKVPTVSLYNVKGQKIQSWKPEKDAGGRYMIQWNGTDQSGKRVGSGIYFARIESSERSLVKKIVLLR